MEEKTIRTRRVGSVTLGITMVCFGILFLIHIFWPALPYTVIFQCWPVVFIVLGLEILFGNRREKESGTQYVYDFAAILMLILMLLFAMIMAAADYAMSCRAIW